jgi:hypothetical protein
MVDHLAEKDPPAANAELEYYSPPQRRSDAGGLRCTAGERWPKVRGGKQVVKYTPNRKSTFISTRLDAEHITVVQPFQAWNLYTVACGLYQ